jgi:hypothetical protein
VRPTRARWVSDVGHHAFEVAGRVATSSRRLALFSWFSLGSLILSYSVARSTCLFSRAAWLARP